MADGQTVQSAILDSIDDADYSTEHPVIWNVHFDDFEGGEFFSIYNPTPNQLSVANWSATDGEGTLFLPHDAKLPALSKLIIARDASSFLAQNGYLPKYCILPNDLGCSQVMTVGSFRLANDGDEILLIDENDEIIDAVLFGDETRNDESTDLWQGAPVPSSGKGRIIQRQLDGNTLLDSNTRSDWLSLREYRPGQSSFPNIRVAARVTPLLLPEHSDLILEQIAIARKSLLICTYEFDSFQVWSVINRSVSRGIDVTILLEGSPVGGLSERSKSLLSLLEEKGALLYLMARNGDANPPRRYPCLHSKYIVIDDHISIILSENLVEEIFDTELGSGNRGWAAILESPEIASRLRTLFLSDKDERFSDLHSLVGVSGQTLSVQSISAISNPPPIRVRPQPPMNIPCISELFVFPDCTRRASILPTLIDCSEQSFYASIFYADLIWKTPSYGSIVSPVIEAAASLMERCEEFVLCLDNSWFSKKDERNQYVIDYLSKERNHRGDSYLIGCPKSGAPFNILHNKGMVLDHHLSWISSVNWNYASICSNRELGLLIDDPAIARFFEQSIITDLSGDSAIPEIRTEMCMAEDRKGWKLYISGESDETGLRSVIFHTSDGYKREWMLMIDSSSRNVWVEIEAEDLWGNSASYQALIFPDKRMSVNSAGEFQLGTQFGSILSLSSGFGMFAVLVPMLRGRTLQRITGLLRFIKSKIE